MGNGFRSEYPDIRRSLWWQYATAAFVLIAFFFLLTLSDNRPSGKAERPDTSADIMSGDWAVKVNLFYGALPAKASRAQSALPMAFTSYKRAADLGSPAGIRRAGVIARELNRPDATEIFAKLTSPQANHDLPKQDISRLKSEAAMWHDIYTGSLTPEVTRRYAEQIKKTNLGPARAYALGQLYTRAGEKTQAMIVIERARERAVASVVPGSLLVLGVILAGIAGIVFIVIFFRNRRRELPGELPVGIADELEEPEVDRGIMSRPWVLFQGFIAYMGLMLVLSFLAVGTIVPRLEGMESDQRLFYGVMLEFALSATTGLLALAILASLVKRAGGTLAEIGLTTRDFGRNVLWGCAGYCALLPILALAAMISGALFRGLPTREHPIVPMLLSGDLAVFSLLFVTGAVFAPIFEEIFFRGVLYRGLRWGLSTTAAVALSAAGFAIVHPQLPAGFLPIFAIGAVFALLAEERKSLVPSMVAHALNNGVIFLTIYFLVMS